MMHTEQWIWLPKNLYPKRQNTICSGFLDHSVGNHTVAEFRKKYTFDKEILSVQLRFSGDTVFQLFCNERLVATGPACVGGDFIGNETPRDNFYSYEKTIHPDSFTLDFFARVRMIPIHICEYSRGRGGFMLSAIITFADGTQEQISTDKSWRVRNNGAYLSAREFDGRIEPDEFVYAEEIENIWNTSTAPIPTRIEFELLPNGCDITLSPHEEKTVVLELDKIWGGFIHVRAEASGDLFAQITCSELEDTSRAKPESVIFSSDGEYRGFYLHSVGKIVVQCKNSSEHNSRLTVGLIATHYPVYEEANTVTSDEDLNLVLKTCQHTLKICRQTHHLDSPRHCEPLACTGDYYVESLMTLFSFGDMRLSEFDLIRTAVMLERHDGRMFHTTYSLIFVKMLYDVYMATGNRELLESCKNALILLLKRFESYIGDNGLLETPPDYMFIDWIYIDGLTMHHPPKALGQTCLNMFYFGALGYAEKIFNELSMPDIANNCADRRAKLRAAINGSLFDAEKGIYFEGLNTPTPQHLLGIFMPENSEKRYYIKHSNILAAYFGVCDDKLAKELIRKIMSDEIQGEYQPYFAHYLLEAVYRLGLREQYTLKILERWKAPVRECSKGLVEGFVAPEPTYLFDHSHAWGGTPLYSLPKALMGMEITRPGMRELRISPSLLGMSYAKAELLTPYGKVICEMKENEKPHITYPEEISVIFY
ncbi:MAG: hypothetical protein IKA74_03270 [Clostridia bacterium]|nr:hypothetical protein [Clostridia bacterium]